MLNGSVLIGTTPSIGLIPWAMVHSSVWLRVSTRTGDQTRRWLEKSQSLGDPKKYPPPKKTNMAGWKITEFLIGDTSSNGCFSILRLVFRGVGYQLREKQSWSWYPKKKTPTFIQMAIRLSVGWWTKSLHYTLHFITLHLTPCSHSSVHPKGACSEYSKHWWFS